MSHGPMSILDGITEAWGDVSGHALRADDDATPEVVSMSRKTCSLCGLALCHLVNRNTKRRSKVWACEHCDQPCARSRSCTICHP